MTDPVISLLYSPTDPESKRLYLQLTQHGLIETDPQVLYRLGASRKIIPVDVSSNLIKQKISSCDPRLDIPCVIIKDPQNQQKHILSKGNMYSWVAQVLKKKEEISVSKKKETQTQEVNPSPTSSIEEEIYEPHFMTMSPSPPPKYTQTLPPQPSRQTLPPSKQPQSPSSPQPQHSTNEPRLDDADPESLRKASIERQRVVQAAIDEKRKQMRQSLKPLNAAEIMAKYKGQ